jgi:predicted acetyltransferase
MSQLVTPAEEFRASFLAALVEYHAEHRHLELGLETLSAPDSFARYVAALRAEENLRTDDRSGRVPQTNLWWVDGYEYLGRIAIRHRLNAGLRSVGGHIGYEIRPSVRHRGHATAMLAAALPIASAMAIDPALITCDVNNTISRRVIEANGGRYAGRDGDELHFWVPTSAHRRLGEPRAAEAPDRPA